MELIDYIPAQTLEWFKFKNIYTGSVGDFRYRMAPDFAENKLITSVYTVYSYKFAKDKEETSFDLSDEGICEARKWVLYKAANSPLKPLENLK